MGQSAPLAHRIVQYLGPWAQAKLHVVPSTQGRPTSMPAQYDVPSTFSQRVPARQLAFDVQVGKHRSVPLRWSGRQARFTAHSPSAEQGSSIPLFPGLVPPVPVVALVVLPGPELVVLLGPEVVVLPGPVVGPGPAPPAPPALDVDTNVLPPALLVDPVGSSDSHCATMLQ